jgi:1-phosphofructokinase family hexose kinase
LNNRQVTTVTPNPAIDKTYWINEFRANKQNRVSRGRIDPGGKGLNIARILKGFGLEGTALGFFGGMIGRELINLLTEEGVNIAPVFTNANTRTNTKIIDPASGKETEINEPGPFIGEREKDQLRQYVQDYAAKSAYLVFSGSLPPGCEPDFYAGLINTAKKFNCKTILDTSEVALQEGIKAAPYLIKPNHHELSELIGSKIENPAAAAAAATKVRNAYGVEEVVVSLGDLGAVMAIESGAFHAVPPKVKSENTIGAGDSLVAGLIYGMVLGYSPVECLRLGVAAGTLAVTEQGTSVSRPQVEAVMNFVKTVEINRLI